MILFVLCNVGYLCCVNLLTLLRDTDPQELDLFLLTSSALRASGWEALPGYKLVLVIELVLLLLAFGKCYHCVWLACTAPEAWQRWHHRAELFWTHVPTFSTFSAMRLLASVNPFVVMLQLQQEWDFLVEGWSKRAFCSTTHRFAYYVFSRIVCLIVGVDGFLVKFRWASRQINQNSATLAGVASAFAFVFQVLNITNLHLFTRERLDVFIFGGEDGKVSHREKAVNYFWYAMLVKRMWKKFKPVEFAIIMLSFSDFDFQQLVLENDPYDHLRECILENSSAQVDRQPP